MRNKWLSIDPTHRIWMSDKPQYMPCVPLNDIMRCITCAVVEESDDPVAYPVGAHFVCFGGVCEYFIGVPGENVLYPAGNLGLPVTADLSVCSFVIGLTAWHGVNKILCPDESSIVCVSGAAGAVGSLVGQLAKLKGAKVIGIAGGAEKCSWLKNDLKFDCVIDYKSENVEKALAAFAPEGISHYFDNVGGEVSDAVLLNMRLYSKYALCGSISEYDDKWSGQKNFNMILMRRISVQGFICVDHMADELSQSKAEITEYVKAGRLKYTEDVRTGLESYPATVRLLMSGANTGKLILQL
jgi:NADPH-dependent curcumin reductase